MTSFATLSRKRALLSLLAFAALALPVGLPLAHAQTPADDVTLTVETTDLRDLKGSLLISVYNNADGFLKDDAKAVVKGSVRPGENGSALVFHLPPGRYAVAVIHDENDNGKLDTNFMGIPTEGYGVSNNPKPLFRAPKYKEAVFDLPANGAHSRISLQYVG